MFVFQNGLLDELKDLLKRLPRCEFDKCVDYLTEAALRKALQFEDQVILVSCVEGDLGELRVILVS